jgi:hypothetical protein
MTDERQKRIWRRLVTVPLIGMLTLLIGGCMLNDNPHESKTVKGDDAITLIDGMRDKGSFEDARQRLNATARVIGDRIAAAVAGQTWRFTDDPNLQRMNGEGSSCEKLTGDIARRPHADTVAFGRTFTAAEFTIAAGIVREEAAPYGAVGDSSLFDEQTKRDYNVAGNGYEFNIGQITFATLNITGDCFLMQRVLDLPAGQLPPEPPIVPTESAPRP